jgi:hypothetical protein
MNDVDKCSSLAQFGLWMFYQVNRLVVKENQWLIIISKIFLFLKLVEHTSKNFKKSKDFKYEHICFIASVVVELLSFLY